MKNASTPNGMAVKLNHTISTRRTSRRREFFTGLSACPRPSPSPFLDVESARGDSLPSADGMEIQVQHYASW